LADRDELIALAESDVEDSVRMKILDELADRDELTGLAEN
jgi:hypothetical protein